MSVLSISFVCDLHIDAAHLHDSDSDRVFLSLRLYHDPVALGQARLVESRRVLFLSVGWHEAVSLLCKSGAHNVGSPENERNRTSVDRDARELQRRVLMDGSNGRQDGPVPVLEKDGLVGGSHALFGLGLFTVKHHVGTYLVLHQRGLFGEEGVQLFVRDIRVGLGDLRLDPALDRRLDLRRCRYFRAIECLEHDICFCVMGLRLSYFGGSEGRQYSKRILPDRP